MTRTMTAWDARRNFGKLMQDVATTGHSVVVESHVEPKVAVVPIRILDDWERRRAAFFDDMQAVAERVDLPEDKAMDLALEAVAAVRAEARAAKQAKGE